MVKKHTYTLFQSPTSNFSNSVQLLYHSNKKEHSLLCKTGMNTAFLHPPAIGITHL